jgi:hypothetical protein
VRFVNLHRDLRRKEGQVALAEELGLLLAQVQQTSTLVS